MYHASLNDEEGKSWNNIGSVCHQNITVKAPVSNGPIKRIAVLAIATPTRQVRRGSEGHPAVLYML
jgi:hypothetical protein